MTKIKVGVITNDNDEVRAAVLLLSVGRMGSIQLSFVPTPGDLESVCDIIIFTTRYEAKALFNRYQHSKPPLFVHLLIESEALDYPQVMPGMAVYPILHQPSPIHTLNYSAFHQVLDRIVKEE
jgi:hypothetical protein